MITSSLIRVKYGRLSGDDLKAARCIRCKGTGEAAAYFTGPIQTCPVCKGSGDDGFSGYTYYAEPPVGVGAVVLVGAEDWQGIHSEQLATVIGIGSTYDGPSKSIIRIVEPARGG